MRYGYDGDQVENWKPPNGESAARRMRRGVPWYRGVQWWSFGDVDVKLSIPAKAALEIELWPTLAVHMTLQAHTSSLTSQSSSTPCDFAV